MGLSKVLTLRTVVATSAGLTLACSSFVAAVQVAGYMAGDSAWLAILTGGLLCLLAATCFSELNGMLPSAAGLRLYLSRAFGDRLALTVSLLYMAVVTGVIGTESYVLAHVLTAALPAVPPVLWVCLMLAVVCGLNIRGIKLAGHFQDLLTYGLLISLVLFSVIALIRGGVHLATPWRPGSFNGFVQALAVGVFLFVGFEWVTPLAEEVKAVNLISRGMIIAVGVLSVTYGLLTMAMTVTVPKAALSASPVPQILFARQILGSTGVVWMTVVSLAASVTTFNAGLISVSRFMYASAREHVLPAVFSKISRYFTPWVAVVTLFFIGLAISILVLITGDYLALVDAAAAMEAVVYTLTAIAVIILRKKQPDWPRPYQIRGGLVIPLVTALVFTILAGAVLSTDYLAGILLVGGGLLSWAYVGLVVPVLKEHHRHKKVQRRRRLEKTAG